MGIGHFLINQGMLPTGESIVEQLSYVLLFSDGGYASKSWKEMVPLGTALDEKQALNSLKWIRDMSLNENCVESLANHDADIVPHIIELEQV